MFQKLLQQQKYYPYKANTIL